jgi:signal transduction histidine kinase
MIPSRAHCKGLGSAGPEGSSASAALSTAPREKEEHLEAELVSVLNSMEAGALLLNTEGRVRFTNARFAQLFDLTPEAVAAPPDYGALAKLIQGRLRVPGALVARCRTSAEEDPTAARDELELAGPAQRVYQRSSRRVRNARGERIGSLEIYRDVSDRRQLQTKLFQTEKMAALGQVVSGIAHELNNPLTGIMGYAQLLLRHGLRLAQLDEARKIYREAGRARRIVKNLLFFCPRDPAGAHAGRPERDNRAHSGAARLRAQDREHRGEMQFAAGPASHAGRSLSIAAGGTEPASECRAGHSGRARVREDLYSLQ